MFVNIFLIVNIVSVVLNWDSSLMLPAIISGVVNMFCYGIQWNFRGDKENLPGYAVTGTLSGIAGVVLLILGIVG